MSSVCWIRICVFLSLLLDSVRATSEIHLDFLALWGDEEKGGIAELRDSRNAQDLQSCNTDKPAASVYDYICVYVCY